jgi:UDP-3-O-[3-hydroxymyristoyl] glucosamine N-acyltransferase
MEAATPLSLVFAVDAGTLKQAINSRAGGILVNRSLTATAEASTSAQALEAASDPRLLPVPDPRYAFALAAKFLETENRKSTQSATRQASLGESRCQIHQTAVLGTSVQYGSGTEIGPNTVIGDGVVIGEGCVILANVTIYSGTILGNRVVVQAGAVLGATGFGYARNSSTGEYIAFPQQGTLVIEDDVEIGANTTIDRGALGETRIGAGTKIDNLVHIAHNCVLGRNVIIAAQTGISGSSVIEDGAILGGQVGLGEHAHVGPGVILGGGAGVLSHKKVRGPGEIFWGRPARPLKQYLRDLARLSRR